MDDILASIRRILSEEETPAPGLPSGADAQREDDVLDLDPTMITHQSTDEAARRPAALDEGHTMSEPDHIHDVAAPQAEPVSASGLVGPATAAAAASSVGNLVRTLAAERHVAVSRNGPSIEDLVREEIRPVLKEWLDAHLPALVERLVRAEIERVVAHASF